MEANQQRVLVSIVPSSWPAGARAGVMILLIKTCSNPSTVQCAYWPYHGLAWVMGSLASSLMFFNVDIQYTLIFTIDRIGFKMLLSKIVTNTEI